MQWRARLLPFITNVALATSMRLMRSYRPFTLLEQALRRVHIDMTAFSSARGSTLESSVAFLCVIANCWTSAYTWGHVAFLYNYVNAEVSKVCLCVWTMLY